MEAASASAKLYDAEVFSTKYKDRHEDSTGLGGI